jgi:NAD+ kinase
LLVIYLQSNYELIVEERKNPDARVLLDKLGVDATFRYRAMEESTDSFDLVITLGGDGTLLRASHLVGKTPMLAINTAPQDSVGYFCGGTKDTLEETLVAALDRNLPRLELTRMQIQLDGEVVSRRVLNDMLFSHECPAATTRYLIQHGSVEEEHKSSGLWVGPAAGSTAAQRSAGGRVLPPSSTQLQYVVREPYMPNGTRYRLVKGLIEAGDSLRITSKVHGALLYVDGPHMRRNVALGSIITLNKSPEALTVLGFRARKSSQRP